MKKSNISIYNDDVIEYAADNIKAINEYLKSNDIKPTESAVYDTAHEWINYDAEHLRELIINFDKKYNCEICVVAVLGLWYGKRNASAVFNSLYDCFYKCVEDVNAVYFKNHRTTLTLDAAHHDGVNLFKFYYLKNNKKYAINFNTFMDY